MSFSSATIPQERLLPGIHGLRGLAALAIVLYHVVHVGGVAVPAEFTFISSEFAKAVQLFFVLSAYSLMHSTTGAMQRQGWVSEYVVKRYFRIAPLYYAVLILLIFRSVHLSGAVQYDPASILLNLTFLFGFAPWTGIVWAGWSVGVEMLFYAIFPVLLLTIRSSRATLVLVSISIVLSAAAFSQFSAHYAHTRTVYGYNWAHYSFVPNLCYFTMGVYAFRVAQDLDWRSVTARRSVLAFCTVLVGALVLSEVFVPLEGPWEGFLWGTAFAGLSLWQGAMPSRVVANYALQFVGERSYSIYLLHPVVIHFARKPIHAVYDSLTPHMGAYAYFVTVAFVLAVLFCASEISYRFIEVPGITLGRRLIHRMRAATQEGGRF
ncbi:MAG TPA: acyltransferase [Gammaproteobacteria bacterium]|jgi:peptidoglycan/LPS O-acetylase OafA/YrhL